MYRLYSVVPLCLLFMTAAVAVQGKGLTDKEMLGFLVQDICVDKSGTPIDVSPYGSSCAMRRPQLGSDAETYRRHDWPDKRLPHYAVSGHQASDSVLYTKSGMPVVEQIFDFGGDPTHHFQEFSHNEGDGGQAVLLINGWASLVMTEDAGDDKPQWFIGAGCKSSPKAAELSWLVFDRDVQPGVWKDSVGHLAKTFSSQECPKAFGPAYTRYRRESVLFPFRSASQNGQIEITPQPLDVVISEHYGGASIQSADHLERFYFARGVGWTRWERWENTNLRQKPAVPDRARNLEASGRCPDVAYSVSPGAGWYRVDCRTWTNVIHLDKPWSVSEFHWPAYDHFMPK